MCLCLCAGLVQRAQLFKVSERERESQVCRRDVSWLSGMKWRLIQAPWREAIMSVHFPAAPLWAAIISHRCLDWADHITGLERSHKVGAEAVFALGVSMLFLHHLFVKTVFKFIWSFANILCLHTIRQKGSKEMVFLTMLSSACSCAAILKSVSLDDWSPNRNKSLSMKPVYAVYAIHS